MSPHGYGRRKPRYLRLHRLQNLRTDHLRRKEARLEGIHPDLDTPLTAKLAPRTRVSLSKAAFVTLYAI